MIALKLGYKDSNLEMTESESVALPFGDTPLGLVLLTKYYYTHFKLKIKRKFKKIVSCNKLLIVYLVKDLNCTEQNSLFKHKKVVR